MKAVLCSINSKYVHSSLASWYLLSGVESYCHEEVTCVVAEGTINQPQEVLVTSVLEQAPDVVGFSCYIWNIEMVRKVVCAVSEALPGTVIVLGGPEVAFCAEQVLISLPQAHYVLVGEGERTFALLLDRLAAGQTTKTIPGLCYRGENGLVCNPVEAVLSDPVSPYTSHYLNRLQGRIAYLETSRGCPFSCAFCLSGREHGVRFFDFERAKRDLITLANSGAQTVKLIDRTFNCNPERAYALFRFILERVGCEIPKGVCFHFEVAADLFDDATLDLLATAPPGLFQMEAGLQSFNVQTLDAVDRKTDIAKLCRNLRVLISGRNIHIHVDLIAGLPYEDFESFGRSFDLCYTLGPDMLQVGFLKFLYGSKLRKEAGKYEYLYSDAPPYEVRAGRWITAAQLARLHRMEDAVERLYNSGRFRRTLDYLFAVTGKRPFELFLEIGEAAGDTAGISLDSYTELLMKLFSAWAGVEPAALRDVMVCDRLECNKRGCLPRCLQVKDPNLSKARAALLREGKAAPGKFGIAVLYSGGARIVAADYHMCDPVTGRYPLRCIMHI